MNETTNNAAPFSALMPPLIPGNGLMAEPTPFFTFTDNTVDRLWELYRAAWSDQTIDLRRLLLQAEIVFGCRNTDAALAMLVSSLRRDLAE